MSGKSAHIVVGLGYGDEGKGTMTDFLCRHYNAKLVVRYNGGSQAGHNVVLPDGRHHCFSQFGSGSFIPEVKTLLSRYMLFDPIALSHEASILSQKIGQHALKFHYIDERTPIITPFHVMTNQIKEWHRNADKHGSCGKGVGELASDLVACPTEVIIAKNFTRAKHQLADIQRRKKAELDSLEIAWDKLPEHLIEYREKFNDPKEPARIAEAYSQIAKELNIIDEKQVKNLLKSNTIVFEGAQGMLLDEWHGFHPYTTWSNITTTNATNLLREIDFTGHIETIGVTRTYTTRHGAGPLVTEADLQLDDVKEHNVNNIWQNQFRVGHLDLVTLEYAAHCQTKHGALDSIAVTHVDTIVGSKARPIKVCPVYEFRLGLAYAIKPKFDKDLNYQQTITNELLQSRPKLINIYSIQEMYDKIVYATKTPINYISNGPTHVDKKVI